jgi:hypothetical protein
MIAKSKQNRSAEIVVQPSGFLIMDREKVLRKMVSGYVL